MSDFYVNWDTVIKVFQQIIVPIISTIISILILYYNLIKIRIRLSANADQGPEQNYSWSVKLLISNTGFIPFSIIRIANKDKKDISFINNIQKFPIKFDPGDTKIFYFKYPYSTKNNYIFAYDHRGKYHKIKIKKKPPLIIPDTFKELLSNSNYRTIAHLKTFINHKFKKHYPLT